MKVKLFFFILIGVLSSITLCAQKKEDSLINVLAPFDIPLPPANADDWRTHAFDSPQSFKKFKEGFDLGCGQTSINIYPVGKFTREQNDILMEVLEYLQLYYQVSVYIQPS